MDLVEIPVYYGKDRPPLADISRKANFQGTTEKGRGCRKWKRVESNKEATPGAVNSSKSYAGFGGMKRPWRLRDEDGEENLTTEEVAKRPRSDLHDWSAKNEVGVASLEWPQSH